MLRVQIVRAVTVNRIRRVVGTTRNKTNNSRNSLQGTLASVHR